MASSKFTNVTTYPAVVGALLRHYRKGRGLDQKVLAEQVGMPQSSLSRVEKGDLPCTVDTLDRICAALGVPASTVLKEAEGARAQLDQQGVDVKQDSRPSDLMKDGLLVLGVASLLAIIIGRGR